MDPVTLASFRADYPEFADTTAFPDTRVQKYITLAQLRLPPDRWGALLNLGVELYTAHNLALAKMRAAAMLGGGAPGATQGVVTSKSVGGVSKSADVGIVTSAGAGTYNLTSYGSEYWQLVLQVGIGGIQVGASDPIPAPYDLGSFGVFPFAPYY